MRKTAAVCVAKLYDIEPTLVEDQGFVESLQELLSDANPMVVANAVASLSEVCVYVLINCQCRCCPLSPSFDPLMITRPIRP